MSSNTEAVNFTAERQTIQRHHVRQTERQSIRRWATTRHVSGEQDVKEIAGTSIGRREVHIRIGNDAKFTLMYEQVAGLAVLLQHHIGVTN